MWESVGFLDKDFTSYCNPHQDNKKTDAPIGKHRLWKSPVV